MPYTITMTSNGNWYVYVLLSIKTSEWYIGSTRDLRKRISRHNHGDNIATKRQRPWKLIYAEFGLNREDARAREKYLKSGMGRRCLKNRMKFFFS